MASVELSNNQTGGKLEMIVMITKIAMVASKR